MKTYIADTDEMKDYGQKLGRTFRGGEVLELVGDVGAGKTTLVKGIAIGLGVEDDVQSPSFTLSRVYEARDGLQLHHYDFYRLHDAGIMSYEVAESVNDSKVVTVIEWAASVANVLPENRQRIIIAYKPSGVGREIDVESKI